MISKYNSFIVDMLLEKAINESFLYYSPNVRKALSRIKGNDIATELLGSEGTDVKPDMTFIDLGKEGYFSFITMRNAKPLLATKYPNTDWSTNIDTKPMPDPEMYSNDLHDFDMDSDRSDSSGVFTKSRNEVGLGRFVNKLFPGKYNSKQVEEFVNSFKASLEKAGEYFDLVEGEDIEFWYNSENYKENSGTLGNSCMAQKRNLFGIYTQNQDVCKMLILKEDDKIIGRALVWKLKSLNISKDEDPGFFMDRQYTIKESDVQKFRNYAIEQGWSYKSYNNHHSFGTININGEDKEITVRHELYYYSRDDGHMVEYDSEDDIERFNRWIDEDLEDVEVPSDGILTLPYNGGGDSGYIESSFEPTGDAVPASIENWCYNELENHFGGWEINEGSDGVFIFNFNDSTVTLEHTYNTEENQTDTLYEESFAK